MVCDHTLPRPAPAARANPPGPDERIGPYRIEVDVNADGDASVTEHLTYDHGAEPDERRLARQLLLRMPCTDRWDRVVPLSDLSVEDGAGAAIDAEVDEDGPVTVVQIGDADAPAAGVEEYVIRYQLESIAFDSSSTQILTWYLVGDDWDVPITDLSVRVELPVASRGFPICWAGKPDVRRRCTEVRQDGTAMVVEQASLAPGEPLMVSIAVPEGTFSSTQLVESTSGSVAGWLSLDRRTAGFTLVLVAVGLGLVLLVRWRRPRA